MADTEPGPTTKAECETKRNINNKHNGEICPQDEISPQDETASEKCNVALILSMVADTEPGPTIVIEATTFCYKLDDET